MIADTAVIDAIAHADTVIDGGLAQIGDNHHATDTIYRDAYLTLCSRLYDLIGVTA